MNIHKKSKNNKVLLIRVPEVELIKTGTDLRSVSSTGLAIPLGISTVASVIREQVTPDVEVCDIYADNYEKITSDSSSEGIIHLTRKAVAEAVDSIKPDLVGLSAPFNYQHELTAICADTAKQTKGDIKVVVGGYVTLLPELALNSVLSYDYVFLGEAETSIGPFFNDLFCGVEISAPPAGVGMRIDGKAIVNSQPTYERTLDIIPLPAYDLLPLDKYRKLLGRSEFPLMTSRGCPFDCAFCAVKKYSYRHIRYHSIQYLSELIDQLRYKYDLEHLSIRDDNFTINIKHAKAVLKKLVDIKLKNGWVDTSGFHVNSMDEEFLDLCKQSHCSEVILAIESANERVLKDVMNKRVDLDKVLRLAEYCHRIDIPLQAYFVIGNPGETREEIQQTVDFAVQIGVDHCTFSIATPFPGTNYYDWALDHGSILKSEDAALKLNYMTASMNNGVMDADELKQIQYDANVRVNFLENRKLRSSDGLVKALPKYKRIADAYQFHAIARLLVGYIKGELGDKNGQDNEYARVKALLLRRDVMNSYGKYFEWKSAPVESYKKWLNIKQNTVGQ